MRAESLSAQSRQTALEDLAATTPEAPLDVLVVGGGVVGTAAAFDAATRGLRVGLVEAQDLAQGTSSRSSRLVHGGLRYLQMLDFKLVAEALRERDLLLKHTAPHLVRALPFVFPFEKRVVDRAFIGSGVSLYDAMSMRPGEKRPVPFHRHLSRTRLRQRFRGLRDDKFIGALEYYDAQVDDARLVLTLGRSAHSLGAHVVTRTEVLEYLRAGEGDDAAGPASEEAPVIGVVARDRETGDRLEIHARETILASGVWTGQQQETAHVSSGLEVLASKGIHITVPKDRIPADDHVGVITQTEKSVLFIIPMGEYWSIGTTDTAWHENISSPAPNSVDIDYVLDHVNDVLEADLTRNDVIGTWAGLRPLLQPVEVEESKSSKVSREHTVMRLAPGLSAVAGGKLTTYRVMAEDAVSFVLGDRQVHRESLTHAMPLLGGQGFSEWESRAPEISSTYGWSDTTVDRLLNRYGSLLGEVLALVDEHPELGEEVPHAAGHLGVEFAYAAISEGALHMEDLIERRTRLFHEVRDRGVAAMDDIVAIVAPLLQWNETTAAREKEAFSRIAEAHIAAESSTTDAEAAALVAAATPDYISQ